MGQPIMPKTTWMLVCHILAITKLLSLVKRPLLLATTAAHQRLAEDSVVHQSIRRLEICGDGLRLRSTRGLFYLICAIRDAYRSKKDTSGDDTPASPPRGARGAGLLPPESFWEDTPLVTRRLDITPRPRAGRVVPSRTAP